MPASAVVPLTNAERQWRIDHPVIRIGFDPAYAPYTFFDDEGKSSGIAADCAARNGELPPA